MLDSLMHASGQLHTYGTWSFQAIVITWPIFLPRYSKKAHLSFALTVILLADYTDIASCSYLDKDSSSTVFQQTWIDALARPVAFLN